MERIFLSPPTLNGATEQTLMGKVFASNYIAPCGPMVDQFEQEFAQVFDYPTALATTGATMALKLIFRHLGIQPGDVVICADLTFVASIAPAVELGAVPVFVDCDETSWTMSPKYLRAALEKYPQAKAVVAVDLYGQCCDYDALEKICSEAGVPLISDAAESLGAKYKGRAAGTFGIAGVFSFNGNKIITSGGGGMLLSRDEALMAHARKLSMQARDPALWYEHTELGTNCRMSNVLAAIGLGQFRHLQDALDDKARVAIQWRERLLTLEGASFMPQPTWSEPNHWLTVISLAEGSPFTLVQALQEEGVEARPLWKPMHLQPVFKNSAFFGNNLSGRLFSCSLCLPSGRRLTEQQQDQILTLMKACNHA